MPLASLDDLLLHELRDLLNAERQLLKALPRFARAATEEVLIDALDDHFIETETQVERLVECLGILEKAARGKRCVGMEGLITEGMDLLEECDDEDVCDAAIISAVQRIEHYEISAYSSAIAFATKLGQDEIAELLDESLKEETAANDVLTIIAEGGVNWAEEGEATPPAPPSDLIPGRSTGGNGKIPDPLTHDGILHPKPNIQARPVVERKWRRGQGAH